MTDAILVLNAGSSTLKCSLFDVESSGLVNRVAKRAVEVDAGLRDVTSSMRRILEWADAQRDGRTLVAVGHRVVHGGPDHFLPERVTPALLALLDNLVPLAPLHLPGCIAPIRWIADAHPGLAQIVCFDTAFHRAMPSVAARYALPREYEAAGIRRYGFHGLSYESIAGHLHERAPRLAKGRTIVAHLGNGASLCALLNGQSIDTTMGFTPLDGLVMGTRCGSLDPGVLLYLQQARGMRVTELEDLLYRRSGLLGVSGGIAQDVRTLLASAAPEASEAIDLFVYRAAREIGALTSSLGGLDGLIFTAGIGEHAPLIRERICARLGWLGVAINDEANACDAEIVSAPASRVEVRVIATDEEKAIAAQVRTLINAPAAGPPIL